ncbi:sulfite exporter TauE/SafE family protein [Ectothiorhodospiraceae bacterium BW-2]|nr:sulfite exporter TauE/SafE family protein [Ectothiorhodospiraceae bacterium BW-2]
MAGLLGGVHCIGMCGAIVATLGLGIESKSTSTYGLILLAYNSGRVGSYSVAGAMMGGIGGWLLPLDQLHQWQLWLHAVAGSFMILLGLYLAGWWRWFLLRLEQAGEWGVWRRLQPAAQRLLPVRSVGQGLIAGAVWGWIPCGLVYTVLIWALSSGSAMNGALLMASFGLGTVPNLVAMGAVAGGLQQWLRRPRVVRFAGLSVIAIGVWQWGLWAEGYFGG